jgi:hypothetical protein
VSSKNIIVTRPVQQQATEADREALDIFRRQGVIQLFSANGTDEENEKAWLMFIGAGDQDTLFVSEPGYER